VKVDGQRRPFAQADDNYDDEVFEE